METVEEGVFLNVDVDQFEVAPLPKVTDNRGFIYLVEDTAFPGYVKIGRTINMKKRLAIYNSDKPFNTTRLIAISKEFTDVTYVEKKILEHMYAKTSPTTLSREWFESANAYLLKKLMSDAEQAFDLSIAPGSAAAQARPHPALTTDLTKNS